MRALNHAAARGHRSCAADGHLRSGFRYAIAEDKRGAFLNAEPSGGNAAIF